jgi:hypothetical protein
MPMKQKGSGACLSKTNHNAMVILSPPQEAFSKLYSEFQNKASLFMRDTTVHINEMEKVNKHNFTKDLPDIEASFFIRQTELEGLYSQLLKHKKCSPSETVDNIDKTMKNINILYQKLVRVIKDYAPRAPSTKVSGGKKKVVAPKRKQQKAKK